MPNRRYYLAVQTSLPEDYRDNTSFIEDLRTLQELGFDGVELNIPTPSEVSPDDLKSFLAEFGLTLSMFASGASAKAYGLSLASTDEARRRESVARSREFLAFAAEFGAGVIAGFLKGPLDENTPAHREQLKASISELAPEADRLHAPLLIEAVNRFESPLGHSLDDTYDLIRASETPYVWILPDTWHMNIEESNMEAAVVAHRNHFGSIHFSDNNRYLPGFGCIDFKKIVGLLDAFGYTGKIALEAKYKDGFAPDVRRSMKFLAPILE